MTIRIKSFFENNYELSHELCSNYIDWKKSRLFQVFQYLWMHNIRLVRLVTETNPIFLRYVDVDDYTALIISTCNITWSVSVPASKQRDER